jgi:hypothetical protein
VGLPLQDLLWEAEEEGNKSTGSCAVQVKEEMEEPGCKQEGGQS